jgi:hypothetical protein
MKTGWLASAYVKARFGDAERDWLDCNCRNMYYVSVPATTAGIAIFGFKNKEDAAIFKLSFGL